MTGTVLPRTRSRRDLAYDHCYVYELKTTRLDRPGRPVLHLVSPGAELRDRGIGLHAIEPGTDFQSDCRSGFLFALEWPP